MILNSGEGDTIWGIIVRGSVKEEIFMVIFMGSAGLTRNYGERLLGRRSGRRKDTEAGSCSYRGVVGK